MLMGVGGFEFQGYSYDNYSSGKSAHGTSSPIKLEGCKICHMTSAVGDLGGGHTMKLEYEDESIVSQVLTGCKTSCHPSITSLNYNNKQTLVQQAMDSLKALLVANSWIDTLDNILYPRTIKPAYRSGALFNYMLVLHDGSTGVHNASYILEILQTSIAELNMP